MILHQATSTTLRSATTSAGALGVKTGLRTATRVHQRLRPLAGTRACTMAASLLPGPRSRTSSRRPTLAAQTPAQVHGAFTAMVARCLYVRSARFDSHTLRLQASRPPRAAQSRQQRRGQQRSACLPAQRTRSPVWVGIAFRRAALSAQHAASGQQAQTLPSGSGMSQGSPARRCQRRRQTRWRGARRQRRAWSSAR